MRVRFRGYVPERMPSGETRHRVRVAGDPKKRIVIPVGPDDPAFSEHYHAARMGQRIEHARPMAVAVNSLDGFIAEYLDHLTAQVAAGRASPLTLKQRRSLLKAACNFLSPERDRMGSLHVDLPQAAMLHIQDCWGSKTGQADNTIKSLSAAYAWGMSRGRVGANPAAGVPRIHKNQGGAVAWSSDDLRAFMAQHGEGTTARLWLLLALFTGARRADLAILGRANEVNRGGVTWLDYQPGKKGSAPASLPMAPQLYEAIRAMVVQGPAYLLTKHGRPFASADSLARSIEDWTAQAKLTGRSSHGVRKGLAGLLAEMRCSEHLIMTILTHTNPVTSSVYTKSADRRAMAVEAVRVMGEFKLW
jgi:integrase